MIGGVTRDMLPHLSGAPLLHINRPLKCLFTMKFYFLRETQLRKNYVCTFFHVVRAAKISVLIAQRIEKNVSSRACENNRFSSLHFARRDVCASATEILY